MRRSRRVIVISDLHLAAGAKMMSRPDELAQFIKALAPSTEAEDMELVIAGDFIDFLALQPWSSWTHSPRASVEKLSFLAENPHLNVVIALREFVSRGNALTILVGNHDVELSLPAVQQHLLGLLDAWPHQVHFVADGRAHTIGRLLIEHGNRYDEANVNDWHGLRAIGSAQSRAESYDHLPFETSAGSTLVERVLNPLKSSGYDFIDLLKPQNELLALLLLAFEPELRWNWQMLAQVFQTSRKQSANELGSAPGKVRNVASGPIEEAEPEWRAEVEAEFGPAYRDLFERNTHPVNAIDWAAMVLTPQSNGVKAILERGEHIPNEQLRRIRTIMRPLLRPDSGATAQYGRAGERLHMAGFQTVVMGHTHLPREVGGTSNGRASYINCGTWIDTIEIPPEVLQSPRSRDDATKEADPLEQVLHNLLRGTLPRKFSPNWAEILISRDGNVQEARLRGTDR